MRPAEKFYFLEVNTRLQVEHGVTEEVTGRRPGGVDGARSPPANCRRSETLRIRSHRAAMPIQARLYAEDPARDFQPGAGLLTQVTFPRRRPARRHLGRDRHRGAALLRPDAGQDDRPAAQTASARAIARWTTRWRTPRSTASRPICAYLRQMLAHELFQRGVSHTRATWTRFPYRPTASRCSPAAPRPRCRTIPGALATGTSACRRRVPWTTSPSASPIACSATRRKPPAWNAPSPARRCAFTRDTVIASTGAPHGGRPRRRAAARLAKRRRCAPAAC